jgi:hypothetical protein
MQTAMTPRFVQRLCSSPIASVAPRSVFFDHRVGDDDDDDFSVDRDEGDAPGGRLVRMSMRTLHRSISAQIFS